MWSSTGCMALTALAASSCWSCMHVYLTQGHFSKFPSLLSMIQVDPAKEVRVAEEMRKLRERNYKLFCGGLCHAVFGISFTHLYSLAADPNVENLSQLLACVVAYFLFLFLSKDEVPLTSGRLKLMACVMHSFPLLTILGTAMAGSEMSEIMRNFIAGRFCLALVFLDPKVSIPFQFLYTCVDILVSVQLLQHGPVLEILGSQLLILAETIFSSVLMDLAFRCRIHAQLDTAAAESLVQSFRRMLRAVCDGEVLLDQQLQVAQESDGLQHLLMTKVSLKGRNFESLTEEPLEFRKFIEAQATQSSAPVGRRISLRDSAGIRVAADMFHVPVLNLGPEPYHLIAFLEDPEAHMPPDAREDVAAALREVPGAPSHGSRTVSTLRSVASSCAGSCELTEMSLLLDVNSELHDIQEARIKFQRQLQDVEALDSNMPSLRKMLKPTHWPPISQSIVNFAAQCRRDPRVQPYEVKHLPFQLPGQFQATAEQAYLKPCRDDLGKVWLHLHGVRTRDSARSKTQAALQKPTGGLKPTGLRHRLHAFHRDARQQEEATT